MGGCDSDYTVDCQRAVGSKHFIGFLMLLFLTLHHQSFIFLTLKVNISIYLYILSMHIKYGKYSTCISGIDHCFIHLAFDSGAYCPSVSPTFTCALESRPLPACHQQCCRKQPQPCLFTVDITFFVVDNKPRSRSS